LKDLSEVDCACAGAGDGVAGAAEALEGGAGPGAAGVATEAAGAGVDGTAGLAGAAFGYIVSDLVNLLSLSLCTHLGSHADDESLLFDLVRLDGVVILEDLAFAEYQYPVSFSFSYHVSYRNRSAFAKKAPIPSQRRSLT